MFTIIILYSKTYLYQLQRQITDTNRFFFSFYSLENISITMAIQILSASIKKKQFNLFTGNMEL
ncbi:MAG: hypothetical protein QM503_12870 [Bacteroidota bacterium]